MIAYDKSLLENTFLYERATLLNQQGFVSQSQLNTIKQKLAILKNHHSMLIRIGFFILGCILYSSFIGVLALFTIGIIDSHFWIPLLLNTILGYVISEFLAKSQQQFRYGLDDAFILGFQGFFCTTIGVLFNSTLAGLIAMSVIGLFACLRYVHTLSILVSLVGISSAIAYSVMELKLLSSAFLPFLMLVLALLFYYSSVKLKKNSNYIYYENAVLLTDGFSLVLGYLSMNYLVVRELSETLLGLTIAKGADIPFAFLFYGFTVLVPILYLVYALISKNRLMLIVGFLAFGFSIFTFRFYYSILPIEVASVVGGIILFGIAYLTIKKLKNKTSGLTFEPDRSSQTDWLGTIETILVTTQSNVHPSQTESSMPFGGGGFSGGGAGDGF